jgi:hypothetical protein
MLRALTFSVLLEKRELTVKPPLLKPCQTVNYRYEVGRAQMHLSASSCLPFLYECLFIRRLLLGVLEWNIFSLISLEDNTDIRGFVDTDGCQSPPSVKKGEAAD